MDSTRALSQQPGTGRGPGSAQLTEQRSTPLSAPLRPATMTSRSPVWPTAHPASPPVCIASPRSKPGRCGRQPAGTARAGCLSQRRLGLAGG